jgi:hypothetical protein
VASITRQHDRTLFFFFFFFLAQQRSFFTLQEKMFWYKEEEKSQGLLPFSFLFFTLINIEMIIRPAFRWDPHLGPGPCPVTKNRHSHHRFACQSKQTGETYALMGRRLSACVGTILRIKNCRQLLKDERPTHNPITIICHFGAPSRREKTTTDELSTHTLTVGINKYPSPFSD